MQWEHFVGYLGSFLMFSTFWMKTMIPLRLAGMTANFVMVIYAAALGLYPILAMQALMLPVNIYRLYQMRSLLLRVSEAADGTFRPDALIPFMNKEAHADGDVLFRRGDDSHRLYIIREGRIRLEEFDFELGPGEMFGEIGILSDANRRTATAICVGRVKLYSMTREDVTQLFFQNPEFGFFLMRLVTDRLLTNAPVSTPVPQE